MRKRVFPWIRNRGQAWKEERSIRIYRRIVAGIAAMLLLTAGMMTVAENSETVMGEKSVSASDIYSFSFVTQQKEHVNAGKDDGKVRDSAVRSIVDSDEVYYSDSFFERSNSAYYHELARASLALSMTAFNKQHVSLFIEELGYKDAVFYRYNQKSDEDKVALVICHKNITSSDDAIIAVAIRGGQYGDEWGSNGRIGYEGESFGYHYGFRKAAEDAIVQLKDYAAENGIELNDSKLWITGFSRGAAVANVMGELLVDDMIISPENLFDYTFATPSTVSASNMAAEHRGIYNIVNPLDIVTRLPMNASGISESAKGKTVRYNWDYVKYGTTLYLPSDTESAQLQVVQLLENALAFATRNEERYVEKAQEQVIVPALKKAMGNGADVSKRNVGTVLVGALPGVETFLKNELNQLDFMAQVYVAGLLSGKKNIRLEKEHWPETYWGWMVKVDGLELQ